MGGEIEAHENIDEFTEIEFQAIENKSKFTQIALNPVDPDVAASATVEARLRNLENNNLFSDT